jgi:RNA polymerase sigma-70 factor, ECF subfamily
MAFALRRVRREDAEDILAETFLVAWRRFEHIPSEPMPWLLGIARKVIATRRRGDRRRGNLFLKLHDDPDSRRSEHPSTERLEVAGAFNSLSERDREALTLIGWDGLTVPQAAKVVDCSTAAFSLRR